MKRLLSRIRKFLPKRIAIAVVTALAAVSLPLATLSAANVQLEGSLGVANVTAGDTQYKHAVNATYDQVVKVQVYYHNREDPNSGKIANDLRIKLNVPSEAGKKQVISGTISSPDTNTIQDSVTVNLDREDALLEYIPGSAVWKHNKGTNENVQIVEEKISDAIVTNGAGLVIEDAKPCFNFDATVTILLRVRVPSVGVYKKVHKAGTQDQTTTNLAVTPGQKLEYVVSAKNLGNDDLTNVYLRDPLPKGLTFVPGTAKKTYGQYSSTTMTADEANAFFTGKKNVGTLKPGATAYIVFEATVADAKDLQCGSNSLKNIAVVDTDQTGEYSTSATVTTNKECADVPTYSCDLLKVEKLDNRQVRVADFKTSQTNGATFSLVSINWGDNTTPFKGNVAKGQTHTYAQDGNYKIVATATFKVNGQDKTVSSGSCEANVSFSSTPTTPTELPKTGAGSVAGIVAGVSMAGALAHRYAGRRKYQG